MNSIVFAFALTLIVTGAALIFVPAGFLTAGVLLAWGAVRLEAVA